jgi:hypothetical protein
VRGRTEPVAGQDRFLLVDPRSCSAIERSHAGPGAEAQLPRSINDTIFAPPGSTRTFFSRRSPWCSTGRVRQRAIVRPVRRSSAACALLIARCRRRIAIRPSTSKPWRSHSAQLSWRDSRLLDQSNTCP